jgi:hypothetical protein
MLAILLLTSISLLWGLLLETTIFLRFPRIKKTRSSWTRYSVGLTPPPTTKEPRQLWLRTREEEISMGYYCYADEDSLSRWWPFCPTDIKSWPSLRIESQLGSISLWGSCSWLYRLQRCGLRVEKSRQEEPGLARKAVFGVKETGQESKSWVHGYGLVGRRSLEGSLKLIQFRYV